MYYCEISVLLTKTEIKPTHKPNQPNSLNLFRHKIEVKTMTKTLAYTQNPALESIGKI